MSLKNQYQKPQFLVLVTVISDWTAQIVNFLPLNYKIKYIFVLKMFMASYPDSVSNW